MVVRFSPSVALHESMLFDAEYDPPYCDPSELGGFSYYVCTHSVSLKLDGIGVLEASPLTISPASPVDFGSVRPGSIKPVVLTMTNTSAVTQPVDCAAFGLVGPYLFRLGQGSCCNMISLPPGGTCTISALFTAPAGSLAGHTYLASLYYGKAQPDTLSNRVELVATGTDR